MDFTWKHTYHAKVFHYACEKSLKKNETLVKKKFWQWKFLKNVLTLVVWTVPQSSTTFLNISTKSCVPSRLPFLHFSTDHLSSSWIVGFYMKNTIMISGFLIFIMVQLSNFNSCLTHQSRWWCGSHNGKGPEQLLLHFLSSFTGSTQKLALKCDFTVFSCTF